MKPAHKSESPAATGLSAEKKTDDDIVDETGGECKRFDTLAARAKKAGHNLQKVGSGFMLSRWGHVRHFIDLDSAQALIVRMEGGES